MSKELVTSYSSRIAIAEAINALANSSGSADCGYTEGDKSKVAGVSVGATKNRADNLNADKKHKHSMEDVSGLVAAIAELTKRLEALEVAGG